MPKLFFMLYTSFIILSMHFKLIKAYISTYGYSK